MKICSYSDNMRDHTPGLIEGDMIYPLGDALASAGAARAGASMAEVIDALANHPSAGAALAVARKSKAVPLAAAKLCHPINNPPAIWAAARTMCSSWARVMPTPACAPAPRARCASVRARR